MKIDKTCILITGCIKPDPNMVFLTLKDPNIRREQYIDSLLFYLKDSIANKIVFCDNSCSEIDKAVINYSHTLGKQFEWISFKGNTELSTKYGKGYGEGEIVQYALENSLLLKESDSFVKVTGRFRVININHMMRFLSSNKIYFDFQEDFVDTRCYVANIQKFSNNLINQYTRVDDGKGYYLEHAYYDVVKDNRKDIKQFPMVINIQGQSGSTGGINTAYSEKGYYYRSLQKMIRSIKRTVGK